MRENPIIEVKKLKKYFPYKDLHVKAVDDVSFSIYPGETLGLVGESGCGKSTIGKALLKLSAFTSGDIFFKDTSIKNLTGMELKKFRRNIQMIFQDPYSSLNPRMTTEEIIKEPLLIHKMFSSKKDYKKRVHELLGCVGLDPSHSNRFPHEFSGGQRQRIGIARAIALNPEFLVCDEPIAALDVSIQAQIVNLLQELQSKMGLTYLFISHDLAMVRYLCTKVAVMYLGHLVEIATSKDLYTTPLHPYTEALLSAIAIPDPFIEKKRSRIVLPGEIPSPLNPPKGCVFCTRCPKVMPICKLERPKEKEIKPNHFVSCHLYS